MSNNNSDITKRQGSKVFIGLSDYLESRGVTIHRSNSKPLIYSPNHDNYLTHGIIYSEISDKFYINVRLSNRTNQYVRDVLFNDLLQLDKFTLKNIYTNYHCQCYEKIFNNNIMDITKCKCADYELYSIKKECNNIYILDDRMSYDFISEDTLEYMISNFNINVTISKKNYIKQKLLQNANFILN